MKQLTPPNPNRLRTTERPFSWVPFRLLSSGLLAALSPGASLLYFFLCLVADRNGLSFWSDGRTAKETGLAEALIADARTELIAHDLVAFRDGVYQVLSLPKTATALNRAVGADTHG